MRTDTGSCVFLQGYRPHVVIGPCETVPSHPGWTRRKDAAPVFRAKVHQNRDAGNAGPVWARRVGREDVLLARLVSPALDMPRQERFRCAIYRVLCKKNSCVSVHPAHHNAHAFISVRAYPSQDLSFGALFPPRMDEALSCPGVPPQRVAGFCDDVWGSLSVRMRWSPVNQLRVVTMLPQS